MLETQKIVLAARPVGSPKPSDFRLESATVTPPGPGEVLVESLYLSLDPYMRMRMNAGKSYAQPVEVGEVMEAWVVGRVRESRDERFRPGDIVLSPSGWQTLFCAPADVLRPVDPTLGPISTAVGVLGMPGFTAYAGLLTLGKPKPGETVVVAAATGPVGSAVGQIAKLKGARAVGVAGGPDKCAALRSEFGFDVALDHRDPAFAAQLRDACPDGVDIYFENVGGAVFDAVFPLLNDFARVPVCGLIANYNVPADPPGPNRLPGMMREVLTKSLTIRGFIQREFLDQQPAFFAEMGAWVRGGQVRYREDIVDGLERAPEAFMGLLEGRNFGKLLVRLHADAP